MPQYKLIQKRGLKNPPYLNGVSAFPKGTLVRFNDVEDKEYHNRTGISRGLTDSGFDISVCWDSDGLIEAVAPDLLLIEEDVEVTEFIQLSEDEDA